MMARPGDAAACSGSAAALAFSWAFSWRFEGAFSAGLGSAAAGTQAPPVRLVAFEAAFFTSLMVRPLKSLSRRMSSSALVFTPSSARAAITCSISFSSASSPDIVADEASERGKCPKVDTQRKGQLSVDTDVGTL